jgi:hypothetical protein
VRRERQPALAAPALHQREVVLERARAQHERRQREIAAAQVVALRAQVADAQAAPTAPNPRWRPSTGSARSCSTVGALIT